MEFGVFLRNKREEKGISTRELSKRIGKSSNYISSLENGRTKLPSPAVAKKILEELSIESITDVMIEFNIIEKKDRVRALFQMNEESQKVEMINSIMQSIEQMDIDMLSAFHGILKRHKDVVVNLNFLEETNKRSLNSIKDYLDYLVNKE
ncbi:helix-turn-helix transcriptional regulator [Bacillus sp. S/N-304-OC-R1]|uniref:helix-turn-helix domain-containing protein n=1 Tax=Bacillus sp. S/N-304-OC-R1 TaxID=2758034 RepID=UPI001C8E4704|nr:helix-turn-helix transcriptional regulator [Bacillus sp. S/N-304-OC-R1]MBY0123194.1 helix-turn-helix domain-containing protein [Bacillus sp. S/N-304-OC-R1]